MPLSEDPIERKRQLDALNRARVRISEGSDVLTRQEIQTIIHAACARGPQTEEQLRLILDEMLEIKVGWLLFQQVLAGEVVPTLDEEEGFLFWAPPAGYKPE